MVRFKISRYVSPDSDERDVDYSVPFQVAYAISIHKAQGLEYDSVKVLVTSDIEDRISHNIFYTAITRAKRHLVIYWSPESERKILESFKHKTDHRTISLLCAHYPELKELRKDGIYSGHKSKSDVLVVVFVVWVLVLGWLGCFT